MRASLLAVAKSIYYMVSFIGPSASYRTPQNPYLLPLPFSLRLQKLSPPLDVHVKRFSHILKKDDLPLPRFLKYGLF